MAERTRIAVLVSGGGTNLGALLEAEKNGALRSGTISLVISSKEGAYALTRAEKAGVPALTIPKKGNPNFERELIDALTAHGIELIILAGFLCILSADFTSRYKDRILNVHPSLIPAFCGEGFYGLRVHEAALAYGVKVTGATVHFVNEVPDGGKILLQRAVEIREGDTAEILQKRVMEEAEWVLLPKAAELVSSQIMKNKEINA